MRKTRQRKLKQLFENTFERKVSRGPKIISSMGSQIGYIPSEWRRLKKAWKAEQYG